MRGNELLDKMELIDPAYIEAADAAPNKRKSVWAKWGTLAACLCLVCVLAVPAMAAFSPAFYELLYAVTPATAQFFINVADNDFLNHTAPTARGWGYAVFGRVVAGTEVVDAIAGVKTASRSWYADVPVDDVVIEKVEEI